MTLAYEADTILRSSPHLRGAEASGMSGELVDAKAAARDGKIVDLDCAAATIPPAFGPPLWEGLPVIDAGMLDQAPLPRPDEGPTLVLLTKRFRNLPKGGDRIHVHPSEAVPADKLDFTDPQKLRDAWAMGEEDARSFLRNIKTIARP